jgi:hypothetical protein
MNGIRIKDMHPRRVLSFDLKDLLELVKHEINDSMWLCEYVEATATSSPNVEDVGKQQRIGFKLPSCLRSKEYKSGH